MISLDEALKSLKNAIPENAQTKECSLSEALGHVTASDIIAPSSLPRFTNTGVDGYAFCHEDERDVYTLVGASYAGEPYRAKIKAGEAARIATGAVLPEGADTVVMQEYCKVEGDQLYLDPVPPQGAHLRHSGADIAEGDIALPKNKKLTAQDIALLGALGIKKVTVKRPLCIAVASTGLELEAADEGQGDTGSKAGKIIDTNTLMLTQMLEGCGIDVEQARALPDDYEQTATAFKTLCQRHDIIVTTGGVSVGDRDFVRDILHEQAEVIFWKIAIRPGKPVLVARMGETIIVGLPGNPVSAFVTSYLIVRAVIRCLNGEETELPDGFPVPLATSISKPEHLRCFLRARYEGGKVTAYHDQSSNLYSSLTQANGLIDLPVGKSSAEKGETVIFRPFSLFS